MHEANFHELSNDFLVFKIKFINILLRKNATKTSLLP